MFSRAANAGFRWNVVTVVGIVAVFLALDCGSAAASPPSIVSTAVAEESVTATSATLVGSINPNGLLTTYRFEYLTQAAYEGNLEAQPPRDAFAGATFAPVIGAGPAGAGTTAIRVSQRLTGLPPEAAFRYRLRAVNAAQEVALSVARPFSTQPPTNSFELLDHRGWEMVSPTEKSGGSIQPPGQVSGGGLFQAAVGGGLFSYSSADSFGADARGAPSGSQYLSVRGDAGWSTADITTPLLSGSYGSEPDGVPYQLFSGDLGSGLLSNGERCRGVTAGGCPVANPPLPGSGAPAGYRNYYRRNGAGEFESLLTAADLSHTDLGPDEFELRLVSATPDLAHVVVSSCAALTADATEVAAPGGCDPAEQNLYEWSGGALSLINVLPNETVGTPGAEIGAPSGAVSTDGSRVYFTSREGIYLREGSTTKVVIEAPEAKFEGAGADGGFAYILVAGHLDRYRASDGNLFPLTLGTGVEGVLGVSSDGTRAYYARSGAIFLRDGEALTEVASSALPSDWPAATGTARVSADGSHLLFLSDAELTGYPNEGQAEVFLFGPLPGAASPVLTCVSCNPSGEQPQGPASIPGARPNGSGVAAFDAYKPRDLSASGNRVFFESGDALVSQDTNGGTTDVYEWEAAGEGTCVRAGGCVELISDGRSLLPSYFLDADGSGGEAFFLTAESLFPLDPGSYDVYAAREYGGFSVPESPIPCVADACQVLPEAPEDPTPGTLISNSGNPTVTVAGGSSDKSKRHPKNHKKKSKKKKKQQKRGGGRR